MRIKLGFHGFVVGLFLWLLASPASAQLAPMGDHYGGRPSDTGFAGMVNSTGGYEASVPLDLPPTRDGTPIPLGIVSGAHGVGAAGLGWDVPLSFIHMDLSIARRKPMNSPNLEVAPRTQVTLSLNGQTMELVCQGQILGVTCQGNWAARANGALFSAVQSGSSWLVYDGHGHTYTFTGEASYLWVLSSVSGPGGALMNLTYDFENVTWASGTGISIDLKSIAYNIHPTTGCAKHEIDLTYDANTPSPISMSVLGGFPGIFEDSLMVRMHKLTTVDVKGRADCGSFTVLREYQLQYGNDADTQQPRLLKVQLFGRAGTPEATTPIPVATYHYGSATSLDSNAMPSLTYVKTETFGDPSGPDTWQVSSMKTASVQPVGSGQPYAAFQSLTDVTGDGVPDLVYQDSQTQQMMVERGIPGSEGVTATLAAPTVLGDSATHVNGAFEDRTLTQTRFTEGTSVNVENVWRQAIDVNGDGRIDIIDAAETAGEWTVYLNTPGAGASGVAWKKTLIPIDGLVDQLTAPGGHVLDDNRYLPLSRRFTGQEYVTDANGNVLPRTVAGEQTFTEWELRDINGDGYPDFVFNSAPAQMWSEVDTNAPPLTNHYPILGDDNMIEVAFNVGGIAMKTDGSAELFSLARPLMAHSACGVEQWISALAPITDQYVPVQQCTFLDITGDGIPERIEGGTAYIGLGDAFSTSTITVPVGDMGAIATQFSAEPWQCIDNATTFQTAVPAGFRDLTGDGIPDLIELNYNTEPVSQEVYIGTGTGFASTPVVVHGVDYKLNLPNEFVMGFDGIPLSEGFERCDGTLSTTTGGVYDLDGDGKPELLIDSDGIDSVYTLSGGSAPGVPEAGQITSIDNGYGATTSISYRSAKQDTTTSHDVPFPEIVVSSVATTYTSQVPADTIEPTSYAYGDASMIYDGVAEAFTFAGYLLTASLQATPSLPGNGPQANATFTQRNPLASPQLGLTDTERFNRLLIVGSPENVDVLSGSLGTDAWALLTIDPVSDPRIIQRTTSGYASQLVAATGSGSYDCIDLENPYDFDASVADAAGHYDLCASHGFMYQQSTLTLRGAPLPSTSNVITSTVILAADALGRPTSVQYQNDLFRTDDDLCVDTTYAAPTAQGAQDLTAPASRRLSSCTAVGGVDLTYAVDTWEYDGLPNGSVASGFVTGHSLEGHAMNDGSLINTLRLFDATYDAVGNVATISRTRYPDGAVQQSAYTYDPFGLARTSTTITATGAPTMQTSTTLDQVSLDPVSVQDANGTLRGITYDGFDRPLTTSVTPPGGSLGYLSSTTYSGFTEGSNRSITAITFDDPVPSVGAVGHQGTTYLDELGRVKYTDVDLGASYGQTRTLRTQYRTYDQLGRVAFEADPYVSTDDPATAYGTSRFFQTDGTPSCVVRANGPTSATAVSNNSTETFPTCYYHGYSNHLETWGVSEPDANLTGSPQAGVLKLDTSTAIGRLVSRSTSQGSTTLEYATYTQDRLGHLIAMSRFDDPEGMTKPVTSTWAYDALGQLLQKQDPSSVAQYTTYDSWGEATQVEWTDTSPDTTDHRIVANYDALGRVVHREEQNNQVADPESLMDYTYDVGVQVAPGFTQTNVLGRLSHATAPSGTVYFGYDAFGAVTAQDHVDESSTAYVEHYTLRPDGSMTGLDLYLPDTAYGDEHVAYSYDSAARATGVVYAGPSSNMTLYQASNIDPLGHVLAASYGPANYAATYATSGRRLLQDVKVSATSGFHTFSRELSFASYDPIGRELSRQETKRTLLSQVTSVAETYDALGRVHTMSQGTASWQYGYDALGNVNLLDVNDSHGTDAEGAALNYLTAGDEDEICRVAYATTSAGPLNSPCNVQHDSIGNVISQPTRTDTRTLGYFATGQVKSISDSHSTATFRYDPFGNVQELDVDGSTTDNRRDRNYGSLIAIAGVTSPVISRRIPGPGGLIASLRGTGGSWVFNFGEARGTRFTTDQSGNFLQDVAYQPFGEAASSGEAPGQTQYTTEQWNGGDNLAAFDLVQVGARIYDPVIGRFLSRDPLTIARTAATTNPYAFAANDPMNRYDPTGRDPEGLFDNLCGLCFTWTIGGDGPTRHSSSGVGSSPSPSPSLGATPSYAGAITGMVSSLPGMSWFAEPGLRDGTLEVLSGIDQFTSVASPTGPGAIALALLGRATLTQAMANAVRAPESEQDTITYKLEHALPIIGSLFIPGVGEEAVIGKVASKAPLALGAGRQVEAAWGAGYYNEGGLMTTIEHIMYRHGPDSTGWTNAGRFALGTTRRDIVAYVEEALRYGLVSAKGNGFEVLHDFGSMIGFDLSGQPTNYAVMYIRNGIIRTIYPF